MKTKWLVLHNTFITGTRSSHKKALTLFEDTYAKLKAEAANDPDIQQILIDFEPFYLAYQSFYAQKQAILGMYEGYTLAFEKILADMPYQVRVWEGKVRAEYMEDSPEEHMIFPNKRSAFLNGTYEERINAIKSLTLRLANFPVLAPVQALVQTYYNTLEAARLNQQQQEGQNDKLSSLLEKQRIDTCTELYGVLARLMWKYRYDTDRVNNYIDRALFTQSSGTGGITILKGRVADIQNVPIVGAKVSLPEIGLETDTDATGAFEMEVETGTFRVEVAAAGYQTYIEMGVVFDVNKVVEKNVNLAV